jgi:TonB-linked SusC/RagA family outer membrane protein
MNNLIKKLTLAISFIFMFNLFAFGQHISLIANNVTVKEAMNRLQNASGYSFVYYYGDVNTSKKVNISAKNATVSQIVSQILKDQNLNYKIKGKAIIISKEEKDKQTIKQGTKKSNDSKTVKGRVVDKKGEPIIGATVKVKGASIGTVTDLNGYYSLDAPVGSTLEISYIGYRKMLVHAEDNKETVLKEDSKLLNEVVVVGYGTQKKESLTGSISAVSNEELTETRNENLENMLAGKVPGLYVVQESSEPGKFKNKFNIRDFGDPLVIIDGVPRDNMTRLDADDIESVSVLKDASAAVYGVRAANGVVLITTKKGRAGSVKLEYNGSYGFQYPHGLPKSADAASSMMIINEDNMDNDKGGTVRWSQDQINEYLSGQKKSTDWYHAIMRNGAPQTQHTLSISGGDNKIQFYASAGYQYQESFLRSKDNNYEKFNVRSNISAKISNRLKVELNLSGIMEDNHKNYFGTDWIIRCMQRAPAFYPVFANNNPDYLGFEPVDTNPYAMTHSDISGYKLYKTRWLQSSASAEYDIPGIDGLKLKGMFSYDYEEDNDKAYKKAFNLYNYDEVSDSYSGTLYNSPNQVKRTVYFKENCLYQLSLAYKHVFDKIHNIGALLLVEGQTKKGDNFYASREVSLDMDQLFAGNSDNQVASMSTSDGDLYKESNLGLVGRFTYDYLSKYLAEFSFRYDGSSKFASGHRWGFFPSASLGWRISEENFWRKSKLNFIDNAKIRVSYGKLGDDKASSYQFLTGYNYPASGSSKNLPGGYIFNGTYYNSSASTGIANKNITWYVSKTFDIGFDFDAWHGLLGFTVDYYNRIRSGLLATRVKSLPSVVGAALPQENLNGDQTQGFEIELKHRNHIRDFNYCFNGNISFSRSKHRYVESGAYGNSYNQWRNDANYRNKDIWWGYGEDGRYTSYRDIANSDVYTDRSTLPGSYKYEDWNGDGVINDLDKHPIAYSGSCPRINFGMTATANYKGFDLCLLFQGALKRSVSYDEILAQPCWGNDNSGTLKMFLDRWHPKDPLADPFNINTEWVPGKYAYTGIIAKDNSLFRIYNTNYLRLKSAELGYTVPKLLISKLGIHSLRFYINAYNLFTLCNMKYLDPEHPDDHHGCVYPLNKTITFGINIKL